MCFPIEKDTNISFFRRTLLLCLLEDLIASGAAIALVVLTRKPLLAIFNNDPEVISIGYTRLVIFFATYTFAMLYEMMSGYLRGFGLSLVPAILTTVGVCGIRTARIPIMFPKAPTFQTIMTAYPVSLSVTTLLVFIALLCYRPSRRFAHLQKGEV
mgnify:CR=1 FL=1